MDWRNLETFSFGDGPALAPLNARALGPTATLIC
jgi:hypothetical protein